jgi:hypothetical protein
MFLTVFFCILLPLGLFELCLFGSVKTTALIGGALFIPPEITLNAQDVVVNLGWPSW